MQKQQTSVEFMKVVSNVGRTSTVGVRKKFLKREFQLVYKFVNKVVMPRSKKRIVASTIDLFVMEYLSKFELVSLPDLMIEQMYKIVHVKEKNHGMPYGYFLNRVFNHFKVVGKKVTLDILSKFSL